MHYVLKRPFALLRAMAFAHERFMVPWVTVREAGGKDRLQKLVLTFICAAGEIVRIRSTPTCECAT